MACRKTGRSNIKNSVKDTLDIVRRRIDDVPDYKLRTIADYFHVEVKQEHRVLDDCITTFRVYEKLNEV